MKRNHRPHGPAKLEHALAFDQVAQHRNLCCGLYGICLQVVVRRKWTSFSCRPCSLFMRGRPPADSEVGPATVLPMPMSGGK